MYICIYIYVYKTVLTSLSICVKDGLSGGHRADDWDVEKWIAVQRIRVAVQGSKCRIVLEDKENGTLFAEAPQGPEVRGWK